MGKTNFKNFGDDDDRNKKSRAAKHSRNIPGKGMKIVNVWYEEDDNEDDAFEDTLLIEDEVQIQHTKG